MRIALAYNEKTSDSVEQAELLTPEEIDQIRKAIISLGHDVIPVEVSGMNDAVVEELLKTKPELIFNLAEGKTGESREAQYPAIYEHLGIPYTGGPASLLHVCLDKRLTEIILEKRGVRVPKGCLITPENRDVLDDIPFPILIKPNYEGSSKGITENSIIEERGQADKIIDKLLKEFPEGLDVEQFIKGREFTVPLLEAFPGRFLEIVEHTFSDSDDYKIYDYEKKQAEDEEQAGVGVVCPAELPPEQRCDILSLASRAEHVLHCPDMGRVDVRMSEDGTPYFIEVNAIPRLLPDGSVAIASQARGLEYPQMFDLIIRSALKRYGLLTEPRAAAPRSSGKRSTAREAGIKIGRFPTGNFNAITDVEGVAVGHVSHREDDVPIPGEKNQTTCVRTGITAICPKPKTLFNKHMLAGAFVLNGIGEMAGITQAQEWGWIETPILLTNTMSVGRVHDGIIQHLVQKHPELGRKVEVTIPLVGETNDAFLNDVRVPRNSAEDAIKAIETAKTGHVLQGNVGGGTGMISFDFAGGIGTSSRVVRSKPGRVPDYTIGVLVQSNFGYLRNLTIEGRVVGHDLDPLYPYENRRKHPYGSVIVVVATDAPLLTGQLNRLAKRAALGLGRVGSHAASTSGEIVMAFSTGNQISRRRKEKAHLLKMTSVNDTHINSLYEAVIEATEESVLNAMFCSAGQDGRLGRTAPPIPTEKIIELLKS
ncbi:MAG: P1 family peptidase [Candidatus Omnitrophota bacterium]